MAAIDLVLFDLGGVLIELGGVTVMRDLAGIEDDDEVWRRWLSCSWVRAFERGACSAEDFAAGVVEDWALTATPADFLASFSAWPRGPYPGADELLASVQAVVPIGCLSNTNALHWEQHRSLVAFVDRFDHRFLSFELGLLKPDRDLFDRIAELVPVPPERVLFLDDNMINVDGAVAAGFHAARAQGIEEARDALVDAGVLPASTS
jgi:HAD superfamily hydrolase (TIGR01509 family)